MRSIFSALLGFGCVAFLPAPAFSQGLGSGGGLKENLDLPYDAGGQEEEDEDAPEVIQFYGQLYEGDGIFYTIDRSGSMQDSGELQIAKREVTKNVSEFSNRVQFGIVFFDRDVRKHPQSGSPAQADSSEKQRAIAFVNNMGGGSGSCCQQGIIAALQYANKATVQRKTVIYVGDGGGTCNGANEDEYLNQTLAAVKGQNHDHAQVNTIGVLMSGRDKQREFLQKLARMNNGTYTEITR